jgi:hypothetical protein
LKPPQLTALLSVDCCYAAEATEHAAAIFRDFLHRYQSMVARLQAAVPQAVVTLAQGGDLPAWQQAACQQLAQLPQSPGRANSGLLLANIVASKGKFAGQCALQQMGMGEVEAAAIVGDPDMQGCAQSICDFYEHNQVGATLSFHVASSP